MNYKRELKNKVLKIWGREPQNMAELAECVIAVLNRQPSDSWKPRSKPLRVVGFSWKITHTNQVSNSHDCPIDGVTNWSGRDNAPIFYPGWLGRVWVRYANKCESVGSDPFRATLTYPGTGGWGGYDGPWEKLNHAWHTAVSPKCYKNGRRIPVPKGLYPEPQAYSWDYRLFDQDWPVITEDMERLLMWEILNNRKPQTITHEFLWEDPETAAQDREFMFKIKEAV